MSEEIKGFSGFTPLLDQIDVSQETAMINTNGDIVNAHIITLKSKDGSEYIFSIENKDLVRLFFLINKILIMF